MNVSKRALRASLVATAALMVFPAAGHAQDTGDTTTGVSVAEELTLVAPATTTLSGLTHATPSTGATAVVVTSTNADWALTATDEAVAGTGHLTDGVVTLAGPLGVTVTDGTGSDLESTGVSVPGALNETKTFNFTQALGAAENVPAGDYALTVTYTVA